VVVVVSTIELEAVREESRYEDGRRTWCQWLTPIILDTQETEIKRMVA
jgi:hypothetical protein